MKSLKIFSSTLASHATVLILALASSYSYGDERVCPDGKRSYFGVCPDEGNNSRPLQSEPPTPTPKSPTSGDLKFKIIQGVGLKECYIGMDASCFQRAFGGMRDRQYGEYLKAPNHGVEASIVNGKINVLFFYFYSRTKTSFGGSTDRGINANSSPLDVIAEYGQPDRIGQSVISEYGAMPGANEKSLEYPRLGVTFTFWDDRLADIRIYSKR